MIFYYDFNSPYAYLAASRVRRDITWQPIAFAFVYRALERTPWSLVDERSRATGMAECEARAAGYGLAPLRWPPGWPVQSYGLLSLRAALAAAEQDQLIPFSLAAFSRHFVDGAPLTGLEDVAEICAGLELDTDQLLARAVSDDVKAALTAVTRAAIEAGVYGVPSVRDGERLVWGDDQLPAAAQS